MKSKQILIIAGEASGDFHAANLVRAMLAQDPNLKFKGIGSSNMRDAGVEIIVDSKKLSIIGLTAIFSHLKIILSAFSKMRAILKQDKPDLVILIDFSGFNLRFAKMAKQAGCQVFYYISPQVWGSRQWRVKTIKRYVDKLGVIFPFEVDFYRRFGIDATFVGHPLTQKVKPSMTKEEAANFFQVKLSHPMIGLLPGSRRGEINRLLPIMLETAKLLQQRYPDAQFILPLASSLSKTDIEPYLQNYPLNIKIVSGLTYDAVNLCDAAIVASGTATLETALLGVPFALIYKIELIGYLIGMLIMKTKYLGICNIIADKYVTREFLQYNTKPTDIANEISKILDDKNYRETMINNFAAIKQSLAAPATTGVSELALRFINSAS